MGYLKWAGDPVLVLGLEGATTYVPHIRDMSYDRLYRYAVDTVASDSGSCWLVLYLQTRMHIWILRTSKFNRYKSNETNIHSSALPDRHSKPRTYDIQTYHY